MKIAILTALVGDRDKIATPTVIHKDVDYISFSDRQWDASIWQQRPIVDFSNDSEYRNRRNAKIYKIMPMIMVPGYDYYLWVDATHDVIENPYSIIETYLKDNDIAVFRHRQRNCVYKEMDEIQRLGIDHLDILLKQYQDYKSVGFPEEYGLFELPVMAWKNTEKSKQVSLRWWEVICKYCSRDQISLPFVLWSLNITPSIIPGIVNGGLFNNTIMTQTRNHG